MSKNKLQKFADILSYPNVYENYNPKDPKLLGENGEPCDLKGNWAQSHFKNDHPITLELACGGGEYSVGLAQMYPERNFIGVDIKGNRIWKGASKALNENIQNVAFLRTRIEMIDLFFEKDEIDSIWITFPDPFLRSSKSNRRLTSPFFREKIRNILRKGGQIHLKTDSDQLYAYTIDTLLKDSAVEIEYKDCHIYRKELAIPELEIKTYYEKMHLEAGKRIKYIRYTI